MKLFLERHRKVIGLIGTLVAVAVAVLYLFIIPGEAEETSGVAKINLQYAHSLCWLLLSTASTCWALGKYFMLAKYFAYSALAVYLIFMATLFVV